MHSTDIANSVKLIFEDFSQEEFIFDLLVAYGISKTSVTRLKKGDFNLSKVQGEVLYKKKLLFKEEKSDQLLISIESLSAEERVLKHSPRFIIVTDFKTLLAKDLKLGTTRDIPIEELPRHYDFFLPLAGSEVYVTKNDNKADRDAAYKMAELYDCLIHANEGIYTSKETVHSLNIFLSRLLFCFFAEDTEIFEEKGVFTNSLAQHTQPDGSDTHIFLNELFKRLNSKSGDEFPVYLADKFPYVNGGLFRDPIESPRFTSKARKILIALGELQWQDINPDIFGSMIQAVVLPEYRSDLGMHYTSVENILKLIKPLFLDELKEEFEKHQDNATQLRKLIMRMSKMKFFDPACGSGNFLIITYKELRALEIEILLRIIELQPPLIEYTEIKLSQFYGIELDDFAHEMAILSLWLAEHQMNKVFEERLAGFGESKPILPLKEAGQIVQGNSCRKDWKEVCPIAKEDEVYIIGNPPYLGSRRQNEEQKEDLRFVFRDNYKSLDYISAWFYKGAKYIEDMNAKCAFVSTNSICQGDQVRLNWPRILCEQIEIGFAYQSFKWINNAKGNAGVTVIIVGLRNVSTTPKYLYSGNIRKQAKTINPYLQEQSNVIANSQERQISNLPKMNFGNMPADGGLLLFSKEEKNIFIDKCDVSERYFRKVYGSDEFINGIERWCLWFENEDINELKKIEPIKNIIEKLEDIRLNSSRPQLAKTPHLFAQITQDTTKDFIIIPSVSSEKRPYIPIGFMDKENISTNLCMIISSVTPWHFAVVTSRMHMVWVRAVGGRLKTDYRYSAKLCYNTFPFPNISEKQKENLNLYVLSILDERAKHPAKTMAQLYDPDTMPAGLKKAHQELDEAIERCYRLQPFTNDTERLEYLFRLYEEMTTRETLFAKPQKRKTKKQ